MKQHILGLILLLFFIAVIIAFAVIEVYVWCTYGNTPTGDIPLWALWLMFGGK